MRPEPVYILDNQPEHREIIELVVKAINLNPRASHYAPETVLAIKQDKPRLIMIDLEYGRDECWEVLQKLQNCERTRGIPIVCMSTSGDMLTNASNMYKFPGGVRFIEKPFDVVELEDAIRSLLEERANVPCRGA